VSALNALVDAVNDEIIADEECYGVAFPSEVPLAETTRSTMFNHLIEDTRAVTVVARTQTSVACCAPGM
jgi:hypothetical protein